MHAFEPAGDVPQALRRAYQASLTEPQEWFLEERVRKGEVWVLPARSYAVFHGADLVEFFAVEGKDAPGLLRQVARQRPFDHALCKSFDLGLRDAAEALGWSCEAVAFLFRARSPVSLSVPAGFELRPATAADLDAIWQAGGDFYDSPAEVQHHFEAQGLWLATRAGRLVGSATVIAVDQQGDVLDLGMVTVPDARGQGIASLVVAQLAQHLEQQGKRVICGCATTRLAIPCPRENILRASLQHSTIILLRSPINPRRHVEKSETKLGGNVRQCLSSIKIIASLSFDNT